MRLTDSEMSLEGLESSSAYDGAMIGEVLLFQANTNIPHEQSVPLIQEVVRRCNSQPKLLDEMYNARTAFAEGRTIVELMVIIDAAIVAAKPT